MKSLDNLISPELTATLRADRSIRRVISRIVPAAALPHVLFCRIDEACLHISVDAAAWITRLRFNERRIIDELVRERLPIDSVRWHVATTEHDRTASASKHEADSADASRQPIPATAALAIRQLAQLEAISQVDENDRPSSELQASLLRLAKSLDKQGGR